MQPSCRTNCGLVSCPAAGTAAAAPTLDSQQFSKLCRDCRLVGGPLTLGHIDILFTKLAGKVRCFLSCTGAAFLSTFTQDRLPGHIGILVHQAGRQGALRCFRHFIC